MSGRAVVIGAGPYGLSVAAHLRNRGVPVRVFGDVMSSWRQNMPIGMCLKSTPAASSLSAPNPGYTLADFCGDIGIPPLAGTQIVPADLFVQYGEWFQRQVVPDVEPLVVTRLAQASGRGFELNLSDGSELSADAVVMASGLNGFAYVPPELARAAGPEGLSPKGLVSHSSQHHDLSVFAGREVAVIGAGQSALESAALLHESGAGVRVLVRGTVRWGAPPKPPRTGVLAAVPEPNSPLGPTWRIYPFSHASFLFRYLPADTRIQLVRKVLGPLGAWWLRERVDGKLPVLEGHRVTSARADGEKIALTATSAAGSQEFGVDHVLAATGYRVDLGRLEFLDPALRDRLRRVAGWPHLSSSFESSVPDLFFTSLTAAETFGPVMRFVCGAGITARRISAAVAGRHGPVASLARRITVTITVIRPGDLGSAEITTWHEMQAKTPALANPFLSPEFTLAVGRLRPSARVAVLSDGPDITGFLPFERRGLGLGVPIAAGLTDCQGLVHPPGTGWDSRALLRACGLSAWRFDHLVCGQESFDRYRAALAPSPVIDLSAGYADYYAGLRRRSPGYVSGVGRKARKLAREVGELRLVADSADLSELRVLMAWKSGQYRRTGRLDRFSQPWIVGLLDSLLATRAAGMTGVLSVLYAGSTPVAAHFGLRADGLMTYWFPAYDPDFGPYSPGLILTMRVAEELAADGVSLIDFGKGKMRYKETLKTGELLVAEGTVTQRSPLGAAHWARQAPQAWAIRQVRAHPPLFRAADTVLRQGARVRGMLTSRAGG